jgi:hypothetical protein
MPASVLFVVAAGAWVGVVAFSRGMGAMPGTTGLSLGLFEVLPDLVITVEANPGVQARRERPRPVAVRARAGPPRRPTVTQASA